MTERDDATIQAREITKSFGSLTAVDRVSFAVHKGEVVGLVGPNGAGKTTTMRLLTGFYTPDSGNVLIQGVDPLDHRETVKRWIGYLPEGNPLYDDLLVSEYLKFVADLRGMTGAERAAVMDRTVGQTGIAEVFYRPIGQLSRGNRQRVGLAQAILHQPEILVLDEPTEGLDPNQRVAIRDLIRSLGTERTILLASHVMGEVEATCDRILVINHGRIVADSSVQELMARAHGVAAIHLEVRGDRVEQVLGELPDIISLESRGSIDGREHYILSVPGDRDPRAEIFELAKEHDWILWELHRQSASLEDIFHELTEDEPDDGGEV